MAAKKQTKKTTKKQPTGSKKARPVRMTDWETDDKLTLLQGWARNGLTQEQIAKNVGCASTTLSSWKSKSDKISEALKKGTEVVDLEVENALLKRALGYKSQNKQTFINVNAKGQKSQRIIVTENEVPPDTTAIVFWLKNRRPDKWRKMAPAFERKTEAEARKLEAEIEKLQLEIEALKTQDITADDAIYIIDAWAADFDNLEEAKSAEKEDELAAAEKVKKARDLADKTSGKRLDRDPKGVRE